jgi:hypothetical protein
MKIVPVVALTLFTSAAVLAQSSIHIEGRVLDSSGAPISDAQITLTNTVSKEVFSASSNRKGKYTVEFLPRDHDAYTLAASKGDLSSPPRTIDPKHVPSELDLSIAAPAVNRPDTYTSEGNILQNGTPVRLVLKENLSSADATTGQEIAFTVADDVIVNGYMIIAHGALAKGTVTDAQAKRRMGKAGRLNVNIDYAVMANGEHAALRAIKNTKGAGHGGAVTTGVVVTAIVFWPAAPLFLLMHGKDIKIPEGTEITAFINGDIRFNPTKFSKVDGKQ